MTDAPASPPAVAISQRARPRAIRARPDSAHDGPGEQDGQRRHQRQEVAGCLPTDAVKIRNGTAAHRSSRASTAANGRRLQQHRDSRPKREKQERRPRQQASQQDGCVVPGPARIINRAVAKRSRLSPTKKARRYALPWTRQHLDRTTERPRGRTQARASATSSGRTVVNRPFRTRSAIATDARRRHPAPQPPRDPSSGTPGRPRRREQQPAAGRAGASQTTQARPGAHGDKERQRQIRKRLPRIPEVAERGGRNEAGKKRGSFVAPTSSSREDHEYEAKPARAAPTRAAASSMPAR